MKSVIRPTLALAAQPTTPQDRTMNESRQQAPQIPPDVLRYMKGAPPESLQFDFLIGDWDVAGTRYNPDGSVLMQYKANWHANYLNDKRMIIDDFKALAPTGQAVSSYVTLRTYSEVTHRWEMAGLSALQPAMNAIWSGIWKDGEMQIDAIGKTPGGGTMHNRIRFYQIEKNSFHWESKVSLDEEKTWTSNATLVATRASH
jgi:hypothetical protein